MLAPTPRDKASAFAAPSWKSATRVASVDADVPPGGNFQVSARARGQLGWGSHDADLRPARGRRRLVLGRAAAWRWTSRCIKLEVKIVVTAAPPGSGGNGAGGSAAGGGGSSSGGAAGTTGKAGGPGSGGGSAGKGGTGTGGTSGKGGTAASGGTKGEASGRQRRYGARVCRICGQVVEREGWRRRKGRQPA